MPVGDGPTAASGSMICFRAEDAEGTPRKKIEIRDPGLLSDLCVRNPREIAQSDVQECKESKQGFDEFFSSLSPLRSSVRRFRSFSGRWSDPATVE